MLDFVLVFSLPKLVFDHEACTQALQLTRPLRIQDDLPTGPLVQAQLAEMHMITAPHTLTNWEDALYLPGPTFDRKNRETWERDGSQTLWQRAVAEVEQRLAVYRPVATDALADAEMLRLIRSGMAGDTPLPVIPPPHAAVETGDARRQRRFRR
ncbi:MAG: trimethylamine methyltransferase family protein [Anaerolineales bacterium]|nr:trimethylamine methyltransferase family protein [Anaerolineales bacterium]